MCLRNQSAATLLTGAQKAPGQRIVRLRILLVLAPLVPFHGSHDASLSSQKETAIITIHDDRLFVSLALGNGSPSNKPSHGRYVGKHEKKEDPVDKEAHGTIQ